MCVSLCHKVLPALLTGNWLPLAVLASWGLRISGIWEIEEMRVVVKISGFQSNEHMVERPGARRAESEPGPPPGSAVMSFM